MEKEIKNLESRQDVLDVWVSKGAMIGEETVKEGRFLYDIFRLMVTNTYKRDVQIGDYSIYEILYSPESNFFDVMPRKKTNLTVYIKLKEDTEPRAITDTNQEVIKMMCMLAHDPLTYLLDNLNETTS